MGPVAVVGFSLYAGGGSFDGTVNAFMPGRSGRRVAGLGFAIGLGLVLLKGFPGFRSAGPRKVGVVGEVRSELLDLWEVCDALLFLRPSLRMEPRKDLEGAAFSDGLIPHAEPGEGMTGLG